MRNEVTDKTFSIVKAIGIVLIVVGHAAINTPLCTFVYLFHIVIFFFVAGYLFNDSYSDKPFLFLRKKLLRFYVPWVVYGVVFVLLHNVFLKFQIIVIDFSTGLYIKPYTTSDIVNKILEVLCFYKWKEPLLAPLWFLFGMFSGLCVFFTITFTAKKISQTKFERYRAAMIVVVMTLGFVGGAYKLPHAIIYRPMIIAGLLYMGKLFRIYKDRISLLPWGAVLCFVGLCIATTQNYQINVGGMLFGNPLLFWVISGAGCYMLLTLAQWISSSENRLSVMLQSMGNYTFTIMVLHYIAFKIPALIQIWWCHYPARYLAYYPVIPKNTEYWWVIYTAFGIAIPMFCALLLQKLKARFGN